MPRVKCHIIYRHRAEYPVTVMCKFFEVFRSGYYEFVQCLGRVAGTQLPYLWLPADVAMAEKPEYLL